MKGFWRNFFYGFGITAIIIVCVLLCLWGMVRGKERMEQTGFQKTGAIILIAPVICLRSCFCFGWILLRCFDWSRRGW